MHTTIKALVFGIATATIAAAGLHIADASASRAPAQTEIVHLERVVIVGKRAAKPQAMKVAVLPRVVIEGHRHAAAVELAANKTAVKVS